MRMTPAMLPECLPAFTSVYCELLREALLCRILPRRHRCAYRQFLQKYRSVDFYSGPVCRCCGKVVCSSEVFEALRYGCLSIPGEAELDRKPFWSEGWAMREFFCTELEKATFDALSEMMLERNYKEVQVNDFVLSDVKIISEGLGFDAHSAYRKEGYRKVMSTFYDKIKPARSAACKDLAHVLIRDFIFSSHFRSLDSDSDDWSFGMKSDDEICGPPVTLAHKVWLNFWELIKKNIHDRDLDAYKKLSPCFLINPVAIGSPLIADWLRLSFELSAINKLYMEGMHSKLEAAATTFSLQIFTQHVHSWPEPFKSEIQPIINRYVLLPSLAASPQKVTTR